MARLMSIKCARCGNTVEFYEGQGMFKCGNCGALYESIGEGSASVRMVHVPEGAAPSTAEAAPGYQPGAPGGGPQQPGWQQGFYPGAQQQAYPYGMQPGVPQYGAYPRRPSPGAGKGMDFLKFRLFITPVFVQILFWIEVVLFIGVGIAIMSISPSEYEGPYGWQILVGIIMMLLGPIFARIWCERLAVHFRTYEELKSINAKMGEEGKAGSQAATSGGEGGSAG